MKSMLRMTAAAVVLGCFAVTAQAQGFPNKPIRIVVPFPAGGVADLVARAVGQTVSENIKQPVVIENKAGASAIIGTEYVAKSAPDGYTLLLANMPVMSINAIQYSNLPYNAMDFVPVIMLADQPYIIAINAAVPAKNLTEFVALAKQQPDKFTFGSASSSTFLAGELFKARTGIRMTHVPYKGSAPAINDLLGGHITLLLDPVITLLPHTRSGKLRALAVTSSKRTETAPEIPSYREFGLVDMDITSWQGIVAPKGTPDSIVEFLNAEFNRAVKSPDVVARLKSQGVTPVGGTAAGFSKFVAAENVRWGAIAKQTNFQQEKL